MNALINRFSSYLAILSLSQNNVDMCFSPPKVSLDSLLPESSPARHATKSIYSHIWQIRPLQRP